MSLIRHTPPGKRLEAILAEMQQDGFTVTPASPSHSLPARPSLGDSIPTTHLLPLHPLSKSTSNPLSESNSTDTAGSADMSRSGSSSTRITSPDTSGRGLRPTASAPPRSDQATMRAGVSNGIGGSKLKGSTDKGKTKVKGDGQLAAPKENGAKEKELLDLLA